MKIDETLESAGRVWQQLSVIIVLHALFLLLAIAAGVIPFHAAMNDLKGIQSFDSIPHLKAFRTGLQSIGLDVALVASVFAVIYVVMFQRLSLAVGQFPLFKLTYSQPGLWRAGKCFDELRQLIHCFEGYTASPSLEDLEVTLRIAIAQFRKDYAEHYQELVGVRLITAELWLQYYSGLCLMTVCSIGILAALHSLSRGLILPIGLVIAASITRCGWEAQVEHAVLGRLRFALNCAVISQVSSAKETATIFSNSSDRTPLERVIDKDVRHLGSARFDNRIWGRFDATEVELTGLESVITAPIRASRLLIKDMELAVNLMMLPPPCLPYQRGWLLFYLRFLRPFKRIGALSLVRNQDFREWLHRMLRPRLEIFARADMQMKFDSFGGMCERYERYMRAIDLPTFVPDERLIVRLLRSSSRLYPPWLLADAPAKYKGDQTMQAELNLRTEVSKREPYEDANTKDSHLPGESFRFWTAKKRSARVQP
jgi:hypothetical protein